MPKWHVIWAELHSYASALGQNYRTSASLDPDGNGDMYGPLDAKPGPSRVDQ